MKNTIALILAAGKGREWKSKFPKVLHKVGGADGGTGAGC